MLDPALHSLFLPLGDVLASRVTSTARIAFVNACLTSELSALTKSHLECVQTIRGHALALERAGFSVHEELSGEYDLILLLPGKQREENLWQFANAFMHLRPEGVLLVSMSNELGGGRFEKHLFALAENGETLIKNKCRTFWCVRAKDFNLGLLREWLMFGEPRAIEEAPLVTLPGVFSWDHIDPASQLLVAHLPKEISGVVADLGAGYGYLSYEILRRAKGLTELHLYEADQRALHLAIKNTDQERANVSVFAHWADVTKELQENKFDLVVTNPPHHEGHESRVLLGQKFIERAAASLKAGGQLFLVANRSLPYEATLAAHLESVTKLAEERGFKVYHGRR